MDASPWQGSPFPPTHLYTWFAQEHNTMTPAMVETRLELLYQYPESNAPTVRPLCFPKVSNQVKVMQ